MASGRRESCSVVVLFALNLREEGSRLTIQLTGLVREVESSLLAGRIALELDDLADDRRVERSRCDWLAHFGAKRRSGTWFDVDNVMRDDRRVITGPESAHPRFPHSSLALLPLVPEHLSALSVSESNETPNSTTLAGGRAAEHSHLLPTRD